MRPWLTYTLVRVGLFLAVFVVLLLVLGIEWWLSAIFAAVIALCISVLALGRMRARVAEDVAARAERRARPTLADVDAGDEDAEIDSSGR